MKVDLHLHCSERSPCAFSTEAELIEAAIKNGLDGIAITEHDRLVPKSHLEHLNKIYAPFKIFTGIEIRTIDNSEDFLVYGIHDEILENKNWLYKNLYFFVKNNNGFLAYAHPFRYLDYSVANIYEYRPDALEIHSTNISIYDEKKLLTLAEHLNIKVLANTDSHHTSNSALYYNDFYDLIQNDNQLVEALKLGRYKIGSNKELVAKYNEPIKEREQILFNYLNQAKAAYLKESGTREKWYNKMVNNNTMQI